MNTSSCVLSRLHNHFDSSKLKLVKTHPGDSSDPKDITECPAASRAWLLLLSQTGEILLDADAVAISCWGCCAPGDRTVGATYMKAVHRLRLAVITTAGNTSVTRGTRIVLGQHCTRWLCVLCAGVGEFET